MIDELSFLRLNPRILDRTVFANLSYEPLGAFEYEGRKNLLACTARSGSSFLSVELDAYGFRFNEWLNTTGYVAKSAREEELRTTADFARHLLGDAPFNGSLSIKAAFWATAYLWAFGEFGRALEGWHVVFLRRENVVRQAISQRIAFLTQQWTSTMPSQRKITDADYDFEELRRYCETICNENACWERLFGYFGIAPLRVVYEDLLDDREAGVRRVAERFGWQEGASVPSHTRSIEKQSTGLNREWEGRFREELRRRMRCDTDAVLAERLQPADRAA